MAAKETKLRTLTKTIIYRCWVLFSTYMMLLIQGKTMGDADRNAQMVTYSFSQSDSVLNLPLDYFILKSSKWRAQKMKIRLAIPKGKQITFADNIDLWSTNVKGDPNYDDTYFANTTWAVEDGKVKCIAGENHKNASGDMKDNDDHMQKVEKKLKHVEEKLKQLDKHHNGEDKDKQDKDGEDKDDNNDNKDF